MNRNRDFRGEFERLAGDPDGNLLLFAGPAEQRVAAYPATACAAFRKQFRHRQSPPSDGIGRRTVSSSHQHGPDRLHENSVPQPAQARRREVGDWVPKRLVMNRIAW